MKRLMLVLTMLLFSTGVIARATSPTGNFAIRTVGVFATPTPVPGGDLLFNTYTAGIPENGGDSVSPWVDLRCTTLGYVEVLHVLSPANTILSDTPGALIVWIHLTSDAWVANGLQPATCDAYLFWDGYHNTRRQKTNTLAAIFGIPVGTP